MVLLDSLVDIGERLRLDALGGVHHQQRAFAGRQAARDFVGKVDMAGRVHEVQDIGLAILGRVVQPDGLGLDRDAAFLLDIHGIEHLFAHLAIGETARDLDQPVSEGRLAVVDMRHDGKIADLVAGCHEAAYSGARAFRLAFACCQS